MKFLLDTNVISEPKQKQPNEKVLEWLDAQDESKLFLSVLTAAKLEKESRDSNQAEKRQT